MTSPPANQYPLPPAQQAEFDELYDRATESMSRLGLIPPTLKRLEELNRDEYELKAWEAKQANLDEASSELHLAEVKPLLKDIGYTAKQPETFEKLVKIMQRASCVLAFQERLGDLGAPANKVFESLAASYENEVKHSRELEAKLAAAEAELETARKEIRQLRSQAASMPDVPPM